MWPCGTASCLANVIVYVPSVDFTSLSISDLLKWCLDRNNAGAWEEFVCRFHRTMSGAVCKTLRASGAYDPALMEDLVQDAFVRLCADRCRSIREFESTNEACFYGYLRAMAINVVRDYFRRVRSIKRQGDATAEPLDTVKIEPPEVHESEKVYQDSLMLERIDKLLQSGDPADAERNRFIFWLHFRDGFSAAEIARLYPVGLTEKGVETVLRRLLNEVKREV
jgi:RNA polymerase sigma-70 factor (ECF subfamily)